jgi:hypothetical protein
MSFCWPGPSSKRTGRPSASTTAWSLVPKPPRERPRAWACAPPFFAVPRRPGHWRGSQWRRSSAIQSRARLRLPRKSGRTRPARSIGNNAASPSGTGRTVRVNLAIWRPTAQAKEWRRRNGGHRCAGPASPSGRPARTPAAAPTDRRAEPLHPRPTSQKSVLNHIPGAKGILNCHYNLDRVGSKPEQRMNQSHTERGRTVKVGQSADGGIASAFGMVRLPPRNGGRTLDVSGLSGRGVSTTLPS